MLNEATNRISLDLNAAREIYANDETRLRLALQIAGQERSCLEAVSFRNTDHIEDRLAALAREIRLDFAGIVDPGGRTLVRLTGSGDDFPKSAGSLPSNPAALPGHYLTRGRP